MDDHAADAYTDATPPLLSLLSKSEKAQRNLSPGTWQHTMLDDNIKALRIALALMSEEARGTERFSPSELEEASRALAKLVGTTERTQGRFAPGTSQHTLQTNRLAALRLADAVVLEALSGE